MDESLPKGKSTYIEVQIEPRRNPNTGPKIRTPIVIPETDKVTGRFWIEG